MTEVGKMLKKRNHITNLHPTVMDSKAVFTVTGIRNKNKSHAAVL